ncbi:hypothetical protein Y032_0384g396 [Ancylostoma ceylanicum]|uniref:Uncharacterized protein n=1 Tax=Ancylostoma ceylanicum TaxID=53326 RepID=A0A016RSN6_9BILA|nr:hypothetical protein Y032_0384g396 [Ancylostoma ceylanicum]
MAIIALQGEEISASHRHAPSTAGNGDDILSHSVRRSSHVQSSPHMWRRDVQAHHLTTMTLYYGPWLKWCSLSGVLYDKNILERLKSAIYRSVVRPVTLYATECWPATKEVERRLELAS